MYARVVVGADGMKGGLWCSPVANTSSPTSSAFFAIATVALMRSCSVGVSPVVGSVVTSPTVKMPNCMARSFSLVFNYLPQPEQQAGYSRGYCRQRAHARTSHVPGERPAGEGDRQPLPRLVLRRRSHVRRAARAR